MHSLCYQRIKNIVSQALIFFGWDFISFIFTFWPCLVRRRQWHPTPILLPGKSLGWRSLVSCSPWGCKESDMTERLHFHFSLSCIGEGNGNPLQCSCLENPRDGVAQNQTRLKRLSSSSSMSCDLWDLISLNYFAGTEPMPLAVSM